jgi:hypothetical protein
MNGTCSKDRRDEKYIHIFSRKIWKKDTYWDIIYVTRKLLIRTSHIVLLGSWNQRELRWGWICRFGFIFKTRNVYRILAIMPLEKLSIVSYCCYSLHMFLCDKLPFMLFFPALIWARGLPPRNSPFHYGLLDLRHSVGLLGRVISSSQASTYTQTPNIHALSGIGTHDTGFRASEDNACLRPRGYRDREPSCWPPINYHNLFLS